MKTIALSAAFAVAASAAFAGSYAAPKADPVIVAPVITPAIDWTGAYAGLAYGQGNADVDSSSLSLSDDFDAYGIFAGYNYDFGKWVLGGDVDYQHMDSDTFSILSQNYSFSGNLVRIRARAGYKLGKFLPYVSAGFADAKVDHASDSGYTYGAGVDYMLTDNLVIGGEYTRTSFDNFDDRNLDVDVDAYQFRVAYKF